MSADPIHRGDNLSDHEPIVMKLCLDKKFVSLSEKIYCDKIAWYKAEKCHITEYLSTLRAVLQRVKTPAETITCENPLCKNINHCSELNAYVMQSQTQALQLLMPPSHILRGMIRNLHPAGLNMSSHIEVNLSFGITFG